MMWSIFYGCVYDMLNEIISEWNHWLVNVVIEIGKKCSILIHPPLNIGEYSNT